MRYFKREHYHHSVVVKQSSWRFRQSISWNECIAHCGDPMRRMSLLRGLRVSCSHSTRLTALIIVNTSLAAAPTIACRRRTALSLVAIPSIMSSSCGRCDQVGIDAECSNMREGGYCNLGYIAHSRTLAGTLFALAGVRASAYGSWLRAGILQPLLSARWIG